MSVPAERQRVAMLSALRMTPLHEHGVKAVPIAGPMLAALRSEGLVYLADRFWRLTERGRVEARKVING